MKQTAQLTCKIMLRKSMKESNITMLTNKLTQKSAWENIKAMLLTRQQLGNK